MPDPNRSPEPFTVDEQPSVPPGPSRDPDGQALPARLGRYRVLAKLGAGGFGVVYRGRDDELRRDVAIKVPHRHRVRSDADIDAYLAEARVLAGLRHPGIVPVHDVGRTDDGLCYIVYQFVEGSDLRARLRQGRMPAGEAVEVTASVAEALHHAHRRGLVHRDIKPANLLLDADGRPVVADFGLALREEEVGSGPGFVGTPLYMSPEQARGEGHRVDARTDIYSLGLVFYELLTGRPPFETDDQEQLLRLIRAQEPRPPRQVDDALPAELDRICLKCLSKRAADRYSTAADLAADLRQWQAENPNQPVAVPTLVLPPAALPTPSAESVSAAQGATDAPHQSVKVVPKGLRSFDAGDAEFFLKLVPGPRDRHGLPESLRFWKTRIEETDTDATFSVGLIYGPSGCGKSSLVKAGLLPRLAGHVLAVHVEATPNDTEARLVKGLRKRHPALPACDLVEALTRLRRQGFTGVKTLLVLDQFEQWLHARRTEQDTELMRALRQCDGRQVQALLLVRDDFGMAATRLLRELEIPLVEGKNFATVDLFDPTHARTVLALFGQAFGRLPDRLAELTREQTDFLDRAIHELAEDGKVISVRLALFAEMVKGKPWTPATLHGVGGAKGVGVAFLEEALGDRAANPLHRLHQRAAQAVLRTLLPEQGSEIKGTMRSREDLLAACRLAAQPRDFDELLRILDTELRLVTPTEEERVMGGEWRVEGGNPNDREELSSAGSVAIQHGTGGEMLLGHAEVPQGEFVQPRESDSPSGGIDSGQHRRGARPGAHEGVSPLPEHRSGITDGAGNPPAAEQPGEFAGAGGTGPIVKPNGPDQPHAQRPAQGIAAKTPGQIPATRHQPPATHFYQLTHDYLVPSLREWLTRKQKETRRGRAALRLAERAALWQAKPENRHLPAWWEWLNIRLFTRRASWTPPQQRLMRKAARVHGLRLVLLLALVTLGSWLGWEAFGTLRAQALVDKLAAVETADVPPVVDALAGYRRWADADLQRLAASPPETRERLHAALALLPVDPEQAAFVRDRLLTARPADVIVLRQALQPHAAALADGLWQIVEDPAADPERRLRAAGALAGFDPDNPRWNQAAPHAVGQLVTQNTVFLGQWLDVLRPIRRHLLAPLGVIYRSPDQPQKRALATDVLADFAADQPELLAELLKDADAQQWSILWPKLRATREPAIALMSQELEKTLAPQWSDPPLDPAWKPVDAAVVQQLEAAQGMVHERFAFGQALPREQFTAVTEALRLAGYRLVNLRPYESSFVAAVWTRDGQAAHHALALTAEQVHQQDAEQRKQGRHPLDVAAYLVNGEPRYAVVWTKLDAAWTDTKLYVNVADRAYRNTWQPWQKQGYVPRTVTQLEVNEQARYSGIWAKPVQPREDKAFWDQSEGDYERELSPSRLQLDVRVSASAAGPKRARQDAVALLGTAPFAGIAGVPWIALDRNADRLEDGPPEYRYGQVYQDSPQFVSTELHGLTPARHFQRCRELIVQGYRPIAISASGGRQPPGPAHDLDPMQHQGADAPRSPVAASVWHLPTVPEAAKEALAQRQAQAAVALLLLDKPQRVWPLLRHSPDPRLRTWIIHRLRPLGGDPQTLLRHFDEERDVSARRALLLCLGEFSDNALSQAFLPRLKQLYRDDPDPGIHGAAEWLLRRWGQADELKKLDVELVKRPPPRPDREPRWQVTKEGHTMVIVPGPVEFWMGSPSAEPDRIALNEPLHRVRIPRTFGIASKEVTVEQFLRFRHNHSYTRKFSPRPDGPMINVNWYYAAEYCNWLSEQEGIPEDQWCYPKKIGEGMILPADHLSRTGYRLPTEAEWEYSCRAGAVTSRYYGESVELLKEYAWYSKSTNDDGTRVTGLLKPNDLGLFDLYGNVIEWCQERALLYRWKAFGQPKMDKEDILYIQERNSRLLRGGSFVDPAMDARSALRSANRPSLDNLTVGVRPARTYP